MLYRWLGANGADLLILDLSMPGRGGLATLWRSAPARAPQLRSGVHDARDSTLAAQALRAPSAHGYITASMPCKPLLGIVVRDHRGVAARLSIEVAEARPERMSPSPRTNPSPREFDLFLLFARGNSVERIAAQHRLQREDGVELPERDPPQDRARQHARDTATRNAIGCFQQRDLNACSSVHAEARQ